MSKLFHLEVHVWTLSEASFHSHLNAAEDYLLLLIWKEKKTTKIPRFWKREKKNGALEKSFSQYLRESELMSRFIFPSFLGWIMPFSRASKYLSYLIWNYLLSRGSSEIYSPTNTPLPQSIIWLFCPNVRLHKLTRMPSYLLVLRKSSLLLLLITFQSQQSKWN